MMGVPQAGHGVLYMKTQRWEFVHHAQLKCNKRPACTATPPGWRRVWCRQLPTHMRRVQGGVQLQQGVFCGAQDQAHASIQSMCEMGAA